MDFVSTVVGVPTAIISSVSFIPTSSSTPMFTFASSASSAADVGKATEGIGAAASIGLGVAMGVVAFLLVAGVVWAVFARVVRTRSREKEKGRDGGSEGRGMSRR